MSRKRTPMEIRVAATQSTVDQFRNRPFKLGRNDCAQMVAWHLRRMNRPVKIRAAGVYHSSQGAAKALKRLGFDSLAAVADAHFPRIPWAAIAPGDLVLVDGDDDTGIGAMGVAVGNGRVLVYSPDATGAAVGELLEAKAAWRVIPHQ